jgi:predicted MPP superfamily phosphohydrolase
MPKQPIRWLHLSDFHVGKDNYGNRRLLEKIIEHVSTQAIAGFVPDLIFITGDVSNRGAKKEYETFRRDFYVPLVEALGGEKWAGKIFAVPGNHDVARPPNDVLNRAAALAPGSHFFDPTKEGKTARDQVIPRFKSFKQLMPGDVSSDWVASPSGSFCEFVDVRSNRLGVVGINTAWLSMDEKDQLKLTPGIGIVEAALSASKAKNAEVVIVLGHHPLSWLAEAEQRRLKALLGHHHAIYLHGHMHRADGAKEEGAGEPFLVFQAGAAFQSRDDELWRNGLLWGELDLVGGQVRMSPRFWNADNYDWPVETGRFPERRRVAGTDWWSWELPKPEPLSTAPRQPWMPPMGWELLDAESFEASRRDISVDEAKRFFDGADPDWGIATSQHLPRRGLVSVIAKRLREERARKLPLVLLLIGPGGEGKSTALRQAAYEFARTDTSVKVLWHRDETQTIAHDFLGKLPSDAGTWLVVSDQADLVAKQLHASLSATSHTPRSDVRFLLATRQSDWRMAGGTVLDWRRCAELQEVPMSGLDEQDARSIANAWIHFEGTTDPSEMGAPGSAERLAQRLLRAARQEATVGEGSLLGGALAVRHGSGLRAHVRLLIDRLSAGGATSGPSLYRAFCYIAAMHALRLDFLSRAVLSHALGCTVGALDKGVIYPLGREAAAGGGMVVLTRHLRIAESAVSILREDLGESIEDLFVDLARAVVQARVAEGYVSELHRWNYELPKVLMASSTSAAIRVARVFLDADPSNSRLAVFLASAYRECRDPTAGLTLLSQFAGRAERGFWYEFGACAGASGDAPLNAWFAGWVLADQEDVPLSRRNAEFALTGLAIAFGDLHEQFGDVVFAQARVAVARLGLAIRTLEEDSRQLLEEQLTKAAPFDTTATRGLDSELNRLRLGLQAAWQLSDKKTDFEGRVSRPHAMKFEALARLLDLSQLVD